MDASSDAKRRIVLTTFGSYGDVNPFVGLALGLKGRGHDPVVATSAHYRRYVESNDLAFAPVRPDVDPDDRKLLARLMHPRHGTRSIVRDLLFGALDESYVDLAAACEGADLLITHPATFAGPIVAERRDLRWISTVLAPASFFSIRDFPVVAALPPFGWLLRAPPTLARPFFALTRRMVAGWSAPAAALRRRLGLAERRDPVFFGQHAPGLVLALFSRLLAAPQPDWPLNVRVTGPIFFDRGAGTDDELERLRGFLSAGPPPIVFTLGSAAVGTAGRFYEHSLAAARTLGRRAVLVVGSHAENRVAGAGPEVMVVGAAPFSELFPGAAAIVHQGGIGTTQQAMRAGRPMLVVPFAHDQPDNARRVRDLGIARALAIDRYTAGRAVRELRRLLEEPAYGERAWSVGEQIGSEAGVTAACDAIEADFRTRRDGW